jgi:ligand-binding SRPBCC domain-containing protein
MRFVFEHWVPAGLDRTFAFFADPRNLHLLHRDDGALRLLHHSGDVAPGSATWVECRVAGVLPVVLGFRHDAWDPPHWFSEQLVHGPFARFAHRHEFAPAEGGTVVRDVLDLRLPGLYGGEAATRWFVARGVKARFRQRHAALARIFGAPAGVVA